MDQETTTLHPRVGKEFTHDKFLQPGWKPEPGQTYKRDSPKARMVVTRVKMHYVFYGYANPTHEQTSRGGHMLERGEFVRRFPEACEEAPRG